MSKELYEEALADVKKVTEAAEDRAKRAVLEAVTPRIRELIERELLGESYGEATVDPELEGDEELLIDDESPLSPAVASMGDAVSLPDEEGKVTLDVDALCPAPEADEYELAPSSVDVLEPVVAADKLRNVAFEVKEVKALIKQFSAASKLVRESMGFQDKISQMISRVEDMYGYVQEAIMDPNVKERREEELESCFRDLTRLQEKKMTNKRVIKEDDEQAAGSELTLKLTGLPDDVDLSTVGVDLVSGDAEEEPASEEAPEAPEDAEGDDVDLGDLELSDEPSDEEPVEDAMEAAELSDDTVVEIDENMLRREIKKMREARALRESDGVDASVLDDFGDGDDEGDAFLDGEVTTESDDLQEDETCDEMDAPPVGEQYAESLQKRLGFEKRVQQRASQRMASLKKEAARSPSKRATLKRVYDRAVDRFNESVTRSNRIKRQLAEASKPKVSGRSNSAATVKAPAKELTELQKKLSATNLTNAKLVYANKLLQNESLTRAQKARVIERLDEAQTVREAKLVYESVVKTLEQSRPVNEGTRRVVGSSSMVTKSASSTQTLNEGFETARWAKLAGLNK